MHSCSDTLTPADLDWRRLLGLAPTTARTPPRLRVFAFGPLRIELDGVPLQRSGKVARKPMELLALLVAQGGRPLDAAAAIDELWPSLDANAPRASLDMAVCRLRKQLGLPQALWFGEGRLALEPRLVWTDVAAFEALTQQAQAGSDTVPWQALALYSDALLGSGAISGRLLARRQQLAQRLCELALTTAERLQAGGAAAAACRFLQRALECEPLCEPLYRALMQAQLAQGECAEALRTHQRCAQLLLARLGSAPAAATTALAERARAPSIAG